jgi:hypothetical protein
MNNIIQGLWIGDKLSRFEYNSIKSYLKQGYEYHLYTYSDVKNIPKGVIIKDGREILGENEIFYYEGSITPFSDLFRYKLLYDKGGVWTDCDIICIRRLPVSLKYIFVAERTILKGAFSSCIKTPPYTCKEKKVLNSFIKCPKGSDIMRIMYEKALKFRNDYLIKKHTKNIKNTKNTKKVIGNIGNIGLKSYHWKGGSKTLENVIIDLHLEKYIVSAEFAFPINWWDFKYVFLDDISYIPPSRGWEKGTYIDDIFTNKNIHLVVVHNGWLKNQGYDKNKKYPENSLFEKLDRFIHLPIQL